MMYYEKYLFINFHNYKFLQSTHLAYIHLLFLKRDLYKAIFEFDFQITNQKWNQFTNNGKEKKNYLSNILKNQTGHIF